MAPAPGGRDHIATIPVYITFVAGTVLPAATLNSQIRDAGNFQLAKPYCNAYNSAGVACTTNVLTLVPLDTELEDNDNMHSTGTNPSRIIFQTTGLFDIDAAADWPSNATGNRQLTLRLNSGGTSGGGTFIAQRDATPNASGATSVYPVLSIKYRAVNVGDYVELFIRQVSGGSLTAPGGINALFVSALWQIS